MHYESGCGSYDFAQYAPSFFHYRPGPLPVYDLGENYHGDSNKYASSVDDLVDSAPQMLVLSSNPKFSKAYGQLYLTNSKHPEYFAIEPFLTHELQTEFVDDAKKIEAHCMEAFRQTTGKELPKISFLPSLKIW